MSVAVHARIEDPERRAGRWAALSAALSVGVLLAALVVANSAAVPEVKAPENATHVDRLRQFVSFHEHAGAQSLAALLRGLGLLLGVGVGAYLWWLVRRRGSPVHPAVLGAVVLGPVFVGAATAFGYFALHDLSDTFYTSGPRTAARASQLVEHSDRLRLASVFDIASRVVFAAWIVALAMPMMRLRLLTTFLGYWAIGAAGALVLLPIGDAMYIAWLASIGFLAWGWWPGGMPEGWARAEPAPAPS